LRLSEAIYFYISQKIPFEKVPGNGLKPFKTGAKMAKKGGFLIGVWKVSFIREMIPGVCIFGGNIPRNL
jgi:hypothetical protein